MGRDLSTSCFVLPKQKRKQKMQDILSSKSVVILMFAFLVILGCATPSSVIDLYKTRSAPENEVIIFGRVKVIDKGKIANLSSFSGELMKESTFNIVVLPDGSSKAIYHPLRGDGYFYLHLPQGGYSIAGFEWWHEGFVKGPIFAHFNAPKDKTITYIGTLGINFAGDRYTKFVEDEYELAMTKFKSEFPEIEGEFTKNLMQMETRR